MDEKVFVSDFNGEIKSSLNLPKQVRIFDTTLRDGEQLPGVSYTKKEKLEIAAALSEAGVDIIEAGFPINSADEFEIVKEISAMGLRSKVCGLARAVDKDIKKCADAEVGLIHTFVSTSDIHLKYQMNKSRKEILAMAVSAVRMVKDLGFPCLFSAMDATRSDLKFLVEVLKAVEDEGVDIINIPDTVGVMTPSAMGYLIAQVRKKISVPIDVHCHNDFGLASATTIASVENGASGAQVTVNGMGERAGNASLEQVVMSLHCLYGVKTNIKTEKLTSLSRLVEKYSDTRLSPHYPLVGSTAFAHQSGIHSHAILKHASTFEPISPEMVGQKRRMVIGKTSGKAGIQSVLEELGFKEIGEEKLLRIVDRIKATASAKKRIYDEDLVAIANDELGFSANEKSIELKEFSVMTGNTITPTASVVLKIGEAYYKGAAHGIGPVDAATNAIRNALKGMKLKLVEYNLRAITGGTDALADVTVTIEDEHGNLSTGHGVGQDIVLASVSAVLSAIRL